MSDDLVDRLRSADGPVDLLEEAACEIERLRLDDVWTLLIQSSSGETLEEVEISRDMVSFLVSDGIRRGLEMDLGRWVGDSEGS